MAVIWRKYRMNCLHLETKKSMEELHMLARQTPRPSRKMEPTESLEGIPAYDEDNPLSLRTLHKAMQAAEKITVANQDHYRIWQGFAAYFREEYRGLTDYEIHSYCSDCLRQIKFD